MCKTDGRKLVCKECGAPLVYVKKNRYNVAVQLDENGDKVKHVVKVMDSDGQGEWYCSENRLDIAYDDEMSLYLDTSGLTDKADDMASEY